MRTAPEELITTRLAIRHTTILQYQGLTVKNHRYFTPTTDCALVQHGLIRRTKVWN